MRLVLADLDASRFVNYQRRPAACKLYKRFLIIDYLSVITKLLAPRIS